MSTATTGNFLDGGEMYDSGLGGPQRPRDPDDEPNPNNPGGISNNELRRRQAAAAQAPRAPAGYAGKASNAGAPLAAGGGALAGYTAGNTGTRAAYDDAHRVAKQTYDNPVTGYFANAGADLNPFNGPSRQAVAGVAPAAPVQPRTGGAAPAAQNTRGLPPSPAAAGVAPPAPVAAPPAPRTAPSAGVQTNYQVDRTQYDAAAQALRATNDHFMAELQRLSGVDPFGNQALMQKATDRAVAQAAGTAAGARGGAAAQAGAQRAAIGVQSQLAARGTQDMAEQARRDAVQAAQLRVGVVGAMGDVNKQLTENEIALANQATQAAEVNLRAQLGGRQLDQAERDSLRNLAVEVAKIDQQRYQTDTAYRESVNANLTAMYQSDNALKGLKMQVDAGENLSADEWMMGLLGAGAGLAQGVMMTSDRRAKTAIKPARVSELREYLATAPGSHYRYREPAKPGRRPGDNFGPMAQDLRKSKIGRTVVVERDGELQVDTGRLALADHAALTHLAARVERLAARLERKK